MEWHPGILQVLCQPAAGREECFLHDVAGIDTRCNARIQSATDHAVQRIAMAIHQLLDGVAVALFRALQQAQRFILVWPHSSKLAWHRAPGNALGEDGSNGEHSREINEKQSEQVVTYDEPPSSKVRLYIEPTLERKADASKYCHVRAHSASKTGAGGKLAREAPAKSAKLQLSTLQTKKIVAASVHISIHRGHPGGKQSHTIDGSTKAAQPCRRMRDALRRVLWSQRVAANLHPTTQIVVLAQCARRLVKRARRHSYLSIITSVDLMTAFTLSPSLSPSRSTEARVMAAAISNPPASTTTSAMTLPIFNSLIVPTI
jgi:hypothetical protein